MKSNLVKIGLIWMSLNMSFVELKAENIMQEINKLLLERKTGERLQLSKYFKKTRMDLPDKMKRIEIINAPIFFKNNVDDYDLILQYLLNHVDEKIDSFKVMTATQKKHYNFKSNYSKFKDCVEKHHILYKEEFNHINKKYITSLSNNQQDQLYTMLNAKLILFERLYNGCVQAFNETSDSYNALLK